MIFRIKNKDYESVRYELRAESGPTFGYDVKIKDLFTRRLFKYLKGVSIHNLNEWRQYVKFMNDDEMLYLTELQNWCEHG